MPICQKQLINFQFNLPSNYVKDIRLCLQSKSKPAAKQTNTSYASRVLHIRLFDLDTSKHEEWNKQFVLKINGKPVAIPESSSKPKKAASNNEPHSSTKSKAHRFVRPLDISEFANERMDFEIACHRNVFHGAASIEIVNVLSVDLIAQRVRERSKLAWKLQSLSSSNAALCSAQKCAVCEKHENLSRCSRCKAIWYCCREHQQQHWSAHSVGCEAYAELIALRLHNTEPSNAQSAQQQEKDNEIICDQMVVSIRDPLSLCKIDTPVRGIRCYHPQCVDLQTYLNYCHHTNTWQCPICMQPLLYKQLMLDAAMMKIIKELPSDIEQVRLNPDNYQYTVITLDEIKRSDAKHSRKRKRVDHSGAVHNGLANKKRKIEASKASTSTPDVIVLD